MAEPIRNHIRSHVIGYVALFLALTGGVAWANHPGGANTITSGDIVTGEVKTGDIGDFEVKAADVAPDSLGGNKIADRSVKNADLSIGASSSNTIADGGIQGVDVKNNTITGTQIDEGTLFNDNSLTGTDIDESTLSSVPSTPTGPAGGDLDGTYPDPVIADAAVTIPKLAFDPATQSELGDHAVSGDHDGRYYTKSELSDSDGDGPNQGSNRVHWDNLTGLSAGFADGQDADSGGTLTEVDTGIGLTGGPITTAGTIDIANAFRLPQDCSSGEVAKSDGSNSWSCAADVDTQGADWRLAGNSGTTGSDFLGTNDNQPLNLRVNNARALRLEPASDGTNQRPNVIGGTADNSVTAGVHSATIGGGGALVPGSSTTANRVTDNFGTVVGGSNNQAGDAAGAVTDREGAAVGGGLSNTASGERATVAGGISNTAGGSRATVGGGQANAASALRATVGGGGNNTASGGSDTVAGGVSNTASGGAAAVGGGNNNIASGVGAVVAGGSQNTAQGDNSLAAGIRAKANHNGAFVWADSNFFFDFASTAPDQFSVRSTGGTRLVSGIDGSGDPTSGLELPAGTSGWSTLGIGEPFDVRVNGARGFRIDPASDGTNQSPNVIGGIADNQITAGVHSATIAGGGRGVPANPATANRVTDHQGTVGGGANNQAGDSSGTTGDRTLATVGGGGNNTASGEVATVGGGFVNTASGSRATVGGGENNFASGLRATVGGGASNLASGLRATVGGGSSNAASGQDANVGGGGANTAAGIFATVPGGSSNTASGDYSLAGGRRAAADDDGAFVWADSNNFLFSSTAANQFSVRSTGGARFVSAIDGTGAATGGVELAPGGGSWSSLSDEASKRAVEPVSGLEVLRKLDSVPISTWSYRSQDDSTRHIGPMAQDFFRAFRVGEDRRHISSVDADGVALAAIKGLHRELRAERRRRHEQERRLARLEERLAVLERAR